MLEYIVLVIFVVVILVLIKRWISTYNQFQRWRADAHQKFADLKVLIRQRLAMLDILSEVAQRYTEHEASSFSDVTKARSRMEEVEKEGKINEQVAEISDIKGVIEDYPDLEASELHGKLMGEANIGEIEQRFRRAARAYNQTVEQYNYHRKRFPTSLIAKIHNYAPLEYISFPDEYERTDLFEEE